MKLISFSMTTKAFLDGRKTVTRRLGWEWLKPGTRLEAVEKAMGLKPGEQVKRLGVIEARGVNPADYAILVMRSKPLALSDRQAREVGFTDADVAYVWNCVDNAPEDGP